uniref:Nuclease HARBI1 n=1 Tax=Cacopsylla melanoneura TaxID=428564 RepID=A0A8D8QR64_9HEMI
MMRIVNHLLKHIEKWVQWPTKQQAEDRFARFSSINETFARVVGCLDGSHIRIPKPKGDNSYVNRKDFPSINLQAICDGKKKFVYVFGGWPGCAHDSRVWQNSPLHNSLETDFDRYMPPSSYLLSDSAYELRSFNITPYSGATTAEQKEFNYQHSKVRVLIEQAFGRLKGIFRRVQKIECTKVENCTKLVSVACIFHNIAIDDNIFYLPEEIVDY